MGTSQAEDPVIAVLVHSAIIPSLVSWLRAADAQGIRIRITSGYRSASKQRALYKAWIRRGRRGIPAAPPGRSLHQHGLAVDFIASGRPDAQSRAGQLAEAHGFRWGGRFRDPDPIHIDTGTVFAENIE